MSHIRFGCQTYTWQMTFDRHQDKLDHIVRTGAQAGFTGLEPEMVMLGRFADPLRLRGLLDENRMSLGALCLVCDWRGSAESAAERAEAERAMRIVDHFPGTMLALCQMPGSDREDLRERQRNLIACANQVAKRAVDRGIRCTYHPNSPPGSIFRTAEDYEILLGGLDGTVLGYAPDLGHIAAGGMDPLAIVKQYRRLVNHVHFKDMDHDRKWAAMGAGVIDFKGVVRHLHETGYDGWIMVEDECPKAEHDPDGATADNGRFVREVLQPLTRAQGAAKA